MLTPQQQSALLKIAAAAIAAEKTTGLPAELSAAQCIFESKWLQVCPGNNCFGIKVDGHGAGVQYCLTAEFLNGQWEHMKLAFESYASLADCFADHARLITCGDDRYAPAWAEYQQDRDLDGLILAIGPIYATAPGYAQSILAEAHATSVTVALQKARAA